MNKTSTILLAIALWTTLVCACTQAPAPASQTAPAEAYQAQHRPQFHFSPPAKWMNDPNGMVYLEGEYHLFYQYYPDSTVWGPMHWGHAVSTDLLHWEHLPIALYPDSLGYIFSGSAVVDWRNSSGLGKDGQPPLIAIFTHHNPEGERAGRNDFQYQSIAYSHDKGRTWTKYDDNPVLPNTEQIRDFRDPKVIWHEASAQWVMVFAADDHVKLWASKDLKSWTHLSDFGKTQGHHGGVWECPDLFPLALAGTDETRWALLLSINPGGPNGGSATQYFIGDFDGTTFTLDEAFAADVAEEKAVWLDYGRDNYAGVTWSDIPASDGRRLFMGWMSNWDYANVVPTMAWRSAMTLPRELSLYKGEAGYRIATQPARELQALRVLPGRNLSNTQIDGTLDLSTADGKPIQMELIIDVELPSADTDFGVELSNTKGQRYRIGYNAANNHFYSNRNEANGTSFSEKFATRAHTAPRAARSSSVRLHLFIDRASAELFADGGTVALTDIFFPTEDFQQVRLYAEGGRAKLLKAEIYALKSIW